MKRVNVGWQMAATLFIPTGLYAFKRINKLKKGSIVFLIAFGSYYLGSFLSLAFASQTLGNSYIGSLLSVGIFGAMSIVLPLYYIRKWSIEYNVNLAFQPIR